MAHFHKIMYVCISHAVLDVSKVFFMCNDIVFQCFGGVLGYFSSGFWVFHPRCTLQTGSKLRNETNFEIQSEFYDI